MEAHIAASLRQGAARSAKIAARGRDFARGMEQFCCKVMRYCDSGGKIAAVCIHVAAQ